MPLLGGTVSLAGPRFAISGGARSPAESPMCRRRKTCRLVDRCARRGLFDHAPLVVMDEPQRASIANRRIEDLVLGLARDGIGIILSTHDPDQAARLCRSMVLLHRGRVLAAGPMRETLTPATLSTLYGTKIRREELSDGSLHFRA
ncbi:ATP-binding cassette domain-containing protein [Paracoccus cavernae]|uniref:hypothetical protein n=1 Tax=Paracoccus cavernae TaxID=1571207 RepID=UPI003639F799